MKNKVIYLILILVLFSCQSKRASNSSIDVVNFKKKPEVFIDKDKLNLPELKAVEEDESEKKQKEKIMSLFVCGHHLRTIGSLSFFKEIKKNKLKTQVVGGEGLGALIAAYYALGTNMNLVEWKFFKLISTMETQQITPYSQAWQQLIEKLFIQDFSGKKVEGFDMSFFIVKANKELGKTELLLRGDLQQALRDTLFTKSSKISLEKDLLANLGANISIVLDFDSETESIHEGHDFLYHQSSEPDVENQSWNLSRMNDSLLKSRSEAESFIQSTLKDISEDFSL